MTQLELDEQAIFDVARSINSAEAREAYVQQSCGADHLLKQRVVALLYAFEGSRSFLESPPPGLGVEPCEINGVFTIDRQITEGPGTTIGPYKLLQQIGEGGMGVVFMAEQTAPVRRKVALKIIKPGMDTRQVIARFEAERQALALMEHPNIARVFDAGTTETGRPYFVMELVHGVPITDYCNLQKLTPPERLRLSPEQAQLSGLDVDTRSDVYSLGVLLYELTTGTTPFDEATLKRVGFDEMRRMIRDNEPLRPSARVATLDGELLSTVADQRKIDPRKLSQALRGDVDWIVMKCLEKDRNRRYESANGLAADIERYLNDEPVQACPPSALYRLGKFARRNKASLSIVGVVAIGMLLGVVGLATSTIVISQAKDDLQQSHRRCGIYVVPYVRGKSFVLGFFA